MQIGQTVHNVSEYKFILYTDNDQEEMEEIRQISEYEKRRQQLAQ